MGARHLDKRQLVPVDQAADRLGISLAQLNRHLDAGLPHLEAYGQRWLSRESLEVMLELVADD